MIYLPPDDEGANDFKNELAGGEVVATKPSIDNSQVLEKQKSIYKNTNSATFDIERVPSMPPAKVDPYKAGMVKVTVPKGGGPGTVLAFAYQKSELRCVVPDDVRAGSRFVAIVNQQLVNDSKKLVLFSPIMVNLMTFTAQFLSTLDQSILDVSLVSISEQLGVSLTEAQWILLAYFLCCSCFLPFAGKLGDRFSRTLVLQVGQLLFLVGSIGCALSVYGGFEVLIAFRCIQGVGASCMMANILSITTYFTELKTRDMAIGYNVVVVGVGLSLGPVVGGLITQYLGWPVCFLINIPIGLIGFIIVFLYVPHTPRNPNVNLDYFAGFLFFIMAGSALLGFTYLADESNVPAVICLSTTVLAIASLVVWHACHPNPLVPKSVFKNPVAMGSYAITLLFFYAIAILRFQLPTVLQRGRSALTVVRFCLCFHCTAPHTHTLNSHSQPTRAVSDRASAARAAHWNDLWRAIGRLGDVQTPARLPRRSVRRDFLPHWLRRARDVLVVAAGRGGRGVSHVRWHDFRKCAHQPDADE